MIYEFDGQARPIPMDAIRPDKVAFGKISLDALKDEGERLGLSEAFIREYIEDSRSVRSHISAHDGFLFGVINIIDLGNILGARDRIAFFLRKNLFLLVDIADEDGSTQAIFEQALKRHKPEGVTLEKLISALFDGLIEGGNKSLESYEFRISEMEDELEAGDTSRKFNARLLRIKKELLVLRTYYEQLIDISQSLEEDGEGIWDKGAARHFKMFAGKVTRLSANTQQLRESLAQLREAYQSMLDYRLNSIMKVFTMIATIFLPLTLLTGWYGMNFKNMPELEWEYGYTTVALAGALVVAACLMFFRRKKLL